MGAGLTGGGAFGDYRVVRRLGKGGMGEVWLLKSASGGLVAAKILESTDHESRRRFLREAELALGVRHPNLVEVFDVGEDPDTGLCYILMEYVPGGTLADVIKDVGPLPIEDAVAVVKSIALVLEMAREKGIVHRDIKPANIMFASDGTPKLADLGIARGGIGGTDTTTVTQTGMMIGTPAYMSPEQMLDAHSVDTRADIYSLGVVFFEMLTGQRPNKDDTIVQLMAKAVKGEPLPDVRTLRPEVSASLAQLLSLMVVPNVELRIAAPKLISSALDKIERGGTFAVPKSVKKAAPPPTIPKVEKKHFPWKVLIPVGLIAGLAAVFVAIAPKRAKNVPARMVVRTNVVEKTHVVTNVVQEKTIEPARSAVRVKDGKYKWEGPEGEWSFCVKNGEVWLGDGDRPALYPLPEGRIRLPASCRGMPVVGISRWAFRGSHGLTEVEISEGCETVGDGSFYDCQSLVRVALPKSIRAIRNCAFCWTKVRSLDLNRVSEWDSTFLRGMNNLEEIRFDSRNRQFVNEDGMILNRDRTSLLFIPRSRSTLSIPPTVSRIEGSACDTSAIRSLVVPSGVRHIGHMAFSYCGELRKIAFQGGDIHFEGQVFQWNTNLVEIKFGEGIRHLDEWAIFSHCSSLRELNLPDSLETMGAGTFEDATSLERIRFGHSLRRIGYRSFGGDTAIKSVTLPPSLREMCAECFKNCSSLRQVRFEGDAPTLVDNGEEHRGVDIFMGTPRDLVVYVKRGSKGWDPNGDGLPDRWPVGAGGNARKIRYADDGSDGKVWIAKDGAGDDGAFRWLVQPSAVKPDAEILVGYCPRWAKPQHYFEGVSPQVKIRYAQNKEIASYDLKNVALAFMNSCDEADYGLEAQNIRRCLEQGVDVVFVCHTPGDVRERLLHEYGMRFEHMPKDAKLEGACLGLCSLPVVCRVAGKGCVVDGDSPWRRMVAVKGDPSGIVLAVRPCGKGRLFFLSGVQKKPLPDFRWWNRVLRGVGVALKEEKTERAAVQIDPEKLKDANQTRAVQKTLDVLFPGWKTSENGGGRELGYKASHRGVDDVLQSHPPRIGVPATFSKKVDITGEHPMLHVRLSNYRDSRHFRLRVRVNGKVVREKDVTNGWTDVYVNIEKWRGKNVKIELDHTPTGWCQEWAFWSVIEIVDDETLVEVARVQDGEKVVKLCDREKIEGTNPRKKVQKACDALFPGWKVSENGNLDASGYEEEFEYRFNNLLTHPPQEDVPVVLSRNMKIPKGEPKLYLAVANQPDGDFELQVKVNGKIIARPDIMGEGWKDLTFDLQPWAGKQVKLELLNMPTGWQQEWAHWNRIEVK